MRSVTLFLAASAVALLAYPAPPDSGPAAQDAPVRLERATVELALIEAYVTDRHDRPIRDLDRDDFVLLIDGRIEPIASVEYRETGVALADEGTGTRAAPGGVAGRPGEPDRGEIRAARHPRRFLLFFDDETSSPQGLTVARAAAESFLADGLVPGDQVAIASFRRRLLLLHDFSTDRASLRRALRESLQDTSRISMFDAESRERSEELRRSILSGSGGTQSALALKSIVREEIQQYRRVLDALDGLVDSLAGWPGYKAIVVFGDGISEYPGEVHVDRLNMTPRPDLLASEAQETNLSLELEKLGRTAAGAGVTVHTIQTAGLVADRAGRQREFARRANALESLALNTGGITSSSNDLLRGLMEADRTGRAYYVIGYAPQGPPDGLYHTVRLRVKRSGARLRYRTGFTRFLPGDAHRRSVQAAHLLPEFHRDLDVSLSAVAGPADGAHRITDLVVHVPPGRVLFLPRAGRFTATVEAGFVAFDGASRETLRLARQVRLSVDPEQAGREDLGINLVTRVDLPVSSQTITAVVSDFGRGAIGAARLALPARGVQRVHGLSLYSLSEKSLWVEIDAEADAEADAEPADFTIGPALKTSFAAGEPLACGFRLAPGPVPEPHLVLHLRAGDRTLRTVEVKATREGGGSFRVRLPTDTLLPGAYRLVVQEVGGGSPVDCGSLDFRIDDRAGEQAAAGF